MRLYRSIMLLLSSIGVILVASACHYRYYLTVAEVRPIAIGNIQFDGSGLALVSADPDAREIMLLDTSMEYVSLGVYIQDTIDTKRQLFLVVDSVTLKLEEPFASLKPTLAITESRFITGSVGYGLDIEPIGVPNDYKRDFAVSFTIKVFDQETDKLIFSDRFTAQIEYYDHKYFLFNTPYD